MKNNQLHIDFKEFIELLNAQGVDYLVVGAFAVAGYGVVRNTGDIDVWVNQTEENMTRLVRVLAAFGLASLGHTVADFMEPGIIVQLGNSPFRIDVLTDIDGVFFDECYPRRKTIVLSDVPVAIIGIEELQKNKASTGRPKDAEDLRLLKLRESDSTE